MVISDSEAKSLVRLLVTALDYEPEDSSEQELDSDDESLIRWETEGGR